MTILCDENVKAYLFGSERLEVTSGILLILTSFSFFLRHLPAQLRQKALSAQLHMQAPVAEQSLVGRQLPGFLLA